MMVLPVNMSSVRRESPMNMPMINQVRITEKYIRAMRLWSKVISHDQIPEKRGGDGVSKNDVPVSILIFFPQ